MENNKTRINKIVLAYSGGLDTSVMLHWLKEQYGCEVICYCADVGQGDELSGLEAKALATGGSKLYVEDLREEFVREYVWTAVKANAVYEGVYLLGTSLARPVIAKRQIEIARREGADAVAHGATGKGNDQVRFELGYYALKPDIKVISTYYPGGIDKAFIDPEWGGTTAAQSIDQGADFPRPIGERPPRSTYRTDSPPRRTTGAPATRAARRPNERPSPARPGPTTWSRMASSRLPGLAADDDEAAADEHGLERLAGRHREPPRQ